MKILWYNKTMKHNMEKRSKFILISTVSMILLVALAIGITLLIVFGSPDGKDKEFFPAGSYRLDALKDGQSCPFEDVTLTLTAVELDANVFGGSPKRAELIVVKDGKNENAQVKVTEYDRDLLVMKITVLETEYTFRGEADGEKINVSFSGVSGDHKFTMSYKK